MRIFSHDGETLRRRAVLYICPYIYAPDFVNLDSYSRVRRTR